MTADAVIEASHLTKRYRNKVAVDDLTLSVRRQEVFGLLGPNGAGKTTTILMLLGLTEPSSGTVSVLGLDPRRRALAVKSRVGYLPDDVGFYDNLTGRANLHYTARLNRIDDTDAASRVDVLLREVGLADVGDRRVEGYSRGMRQRLGLADALVKNPEILVLDEPTVNIDPEGVREILALVRQLRDERGVTVLLASHLLNQVQAVCDRVGIFVDGRLRAVGTVDELIAEIAKKWITEVGVNGEPETVAGALRGVPGVRTVRRDADRFVVESDTDVRVELVDAVQAVGGRVNHLTRQQADLDTVYHHWFGSDDVRHAR